MEIDIKDIKIPDFKSEEQLQAFCFQWFWNTFKEERRMLFHVPNGGGRNWKEGARLKATGVVPGIADLIWIRPFRVIFIELKWQNGTQSIEQKEFQHGVELRGHQYYLIKTFEEFAKLIGKFM